MTTPAKNTKFTVKHLGLEDTRTSHRNYTHVVVGKWAPTDADIRAFAATEERAARENHAYMTRCASVNVGDKYPVAGFTFTVDQKLHDEATSYLAANPDVELVARTAYAATLAKKMQERRDARPFVLQWSMSERAALKAIGTFQKRYYGDVYVALTDQARDAAHGIKRSA